AEIVKAFLVEFQEKYESFYNSDKLDDILDQGRDKAHKVSFKTVKKMEKAMGLGRKR
ncbi:tryptophan--tRNA ligase, partial [Staphylococcus aureus]|nr:tryptophan--tRNA ligase [Staphylococcus aureus]